MPYTRPIYLSAKPAEASVREKGYYRLPNDVAWVERGDRFWREWPPDVDLVLSIVADCCKYQVKSSAT